MSKIITKGSYVKMTTTGSHNVQDFMQGIVVENKKEAEQDEDNEDVGELGEVDMTDGKNS